MGWFETKEVKEQKRLEQLEKEKLRERQDALKIQEKLELYENCICLDKNGKPFVYRNVSCKDEKWFVWCTHYWSKKGTSNGWSVKDASFEKGYLISWVIDGRERWLNLKSNLNKFNLEIKEIENNI